MYAATGRDAHRDAFRLLVADVRDGHGSVMDTSRRAERAVLPVQFGLIDDRLVVTASPAPEAPIGAVCLRSDGVPAAQRMSGAMRLASGTTQWKRTRALQEITTCPRGTVVTLMVDNGSGPPRPTCDARRTTSRRKASGAGCRIEPRCLVCRPDPCFHDADHASPSELASATGVVFDLRGYPTDAGAGILPYLIETSEADRWMHVNKIVGPFGQSAGWQSVGWNLRPRSPRLAGKIVFLTDGRAISYAESVMGYVADRKLATIVGAATAGTNGNVAMFAVPGGFNDRVHRHARHQPRWADAPPPGRCQAGHSGHADGRRRSGPDATKCSTARVAVIRGK